MSERWDSDSVETMLRQYGERLWPADWHAKAEAEIEQQNHASSLDSVSNNDQNDDFSFTVLPDGNVDQASDNVILLTRSLPVRKLARITAAAAAVLAIIVSVATLGSPAGEVALEATTDSSTRSMPSASGQTPTTSGETETNDETGADAGPQDSTVESPSVTPSTATTATTQISEPPAATSQSNPTTATTQISEPPTATGQSTASTVSTSQPDCDATELRKQADNEQFVVKDNPRAIELYEASIACEPNAWAYMNMGPALSHEDRDDDAEIGYLIALTLNPTPIVKYRILAQHAGVHLKRGDYQLAIDRATESIAVPGGESYRTVFAIRAEAHEKLGQFDEALADRTKVIENAELLPHWHNYYARGLVYLELGLTDEARADFEQALVIEPTRQEPQIAVAALD